MSNINVKVTAKAYERGHVKKKLSEFENDLTLPTYAELAKELEDLKTWVRAYVAQGAGGTTGSVSGGGVELLEGDVEIGKTLYGGDIAEIVI